MDSIGSLILSHRHVYLCVLSIRASMVIQPILVVFQPVLVLNLVITALKDVFLYVQVSPATGQILSIIRVSTNALQATLPLTQLIEYVCRVVSLILHSVI